MDSISPLFYHTHHSIQEIFVAKKILWLIYNKKKDGKDGRKWKMVGIDTN